MSDDSVWLVCGRQWHILLTLPLSYSEKVNRQAQGRNWQSKWI